jgi:hypothetical protein
MTAEPALLPPESERRVPRIVSLGGAALLTAAGLALALYLGAWAFEARQLSMHEKRLRNMLSKHPLLEQVTAGLAEERMELTGKPRTMEEVAQMAEGCGDAVAKRILEKADRYPLTRMFSAGDVSYFLYFNYQKHLADYVYCSR